MNERTIENSRFAFYRDRTKLISFRFSERLLI